MMKTIFTCLTLFITSPVFASEFDVCNDTIIDQVTEMAFGQHGIIYSGEVACYRDKDKKILKFKRFFDKGKPIGRHICYNSKGEKQSFMSYNKTSIKTHGFYIDKTTSNKSPFLPEIICNSGNNETCWAEWRKCKEGDKYCTFYCK